MVVDDYDNDNTEYQLSDEEETVYEPEEEQRTTGPSKPEPGISKKPPKKKIFLAIIVIIVVIFVGYRLIHSIASKKTTSLPVAKVTPVKTIVTSTSIKKVESKPVVKKTTGSIKQIMQLQHKNTSAVEALKQQQSDNQSTLKGFHQKLSNMNERIGSLQTTTHGMASQLNKMQTMQQQVKSAAQARTVRVRTAKIRRVRQQKRYFVQAVIPGRAWLRGADGSAITIIRGDKVPGYGSVVAIDPYSGTVTMSSGIKLSYAINVE